MKEQILRTEVDTFNRIFWTFQEFDISTTKYCHATRGRVQIDNDCSGCYLCQEQVI